MISETETEEEVGLDDAVLDMYRATHTPYDSIIRVLAKADKKSVLTKIPWGPKSGKFKQVKKNIIPTVQSIACLISTSMI